MSEVGLAVAQISGLHLALPAFVDGQGPYVQSPVVEVMSGTPAHSATHTKC